MRPVVIGQPGAFGDILVCAPIAKYYADKGHTVYWPVGIEHLSLVEQFPYVKSIPLPNIPLASHPDQREIPFISRIIMGESIAEDMGATFLNLGDRPVTSRKDAETVEEKKYRIGQVPFSEKYKLSWERNEEKENELFKLVVDVHEGVRGGYIFAHLDQSDGTVGELPQQENQDIVRCEPLEGYNILDWYKVIINASKIYCIESSLQCFVDGLGILIPKEKKFLLTTKKYCTTTSDSWNRI